MYHAVESVMQRIKKRGPYSTLACIQYQLTTLHPQKARRKKIFTGLFCVVILHLLEIIGVMFISLDLLKSQKESWVYRRQKIEQCLIDYECLHGAI